MDVLVIEQNIGVACAVADNVAIMVNGRINRILPSIELSGDRELQQRLLGVGRHGHEDVGSSGHRVDSGARCWRECRTGPRQDLQLESGDTDAVVAAGSSRAP